MMSSNSIIDYYDQSQKHVLSYCMDYLAVFQSVRQCVCTMWPSNDRKISAAVNVYISFHSPVFGIEKIMLDSPSHRQERQAKQRPFLLSIFYSLTQTKLKENAQPQGQYPINGSHNHFNLHQFPGHHSTTSACLYKASA